MLRIFNGINSFRYFPSGITFILPISTTVAKTNSTRNLCRKVDVNNINDFLSKSSNHHTTFLKCDRDFSTRTIQSEENVGLLKKVLNKVGFTGNNKSRLKVASYILYENVADKINYLEFFNEFNLPNTFNSWFLVTELHVWMILMRVMAEGSESGDDGRFLRNSIVEAMWADVNTRAKKLGANNPSGTRAQIEILSEQFQAALIAYDEGIMSDDKILAAALWRRFFEQNCDDFILLEKLVKYIRRQVQMLDSTKRDELLTKPKVRWLLLSEI